MPRHVSSTNQSLLIPSLPPTLLTFYLVRSDLVFTNIDPLICKSKATNTVYHKPLHNESQNLNQNLLLLAIIMTLLYFRNQRYGISKIKPKFTTIEP